MRAKICGLTDEEAVRVAVNAGAAYVGFNFFPKSPRYVAPDAARALAKAADGVVRVALAVNPDDSLLGAIAGLPMDMIQLHGSETPARVAEVKARTGLEVMKVIGVADPSDVDSIAAYEAVADQIMIDAKPPKGAVLPGGNGVAFDWRLLQGRDWSTPWMLAGGLTPENVAEAGRLTGADQVDVASGVECAPGVKDPELVRAFIRAAL